MFSFNPKHILTPENFNPASESWVLPYGTSKTDDQWAVKYTRLHDHDLQCVVQKLQEIALNYNFNHPSIVPIKEFYIEKKNSIPCGLYVKMPFMKQNLYDYIHSQSQKCAKISEHVIVQQLHSHVRLLEYLKSKGIAHRAIEPSHIFVDENKKMYLANLSFAMYVDGEKIAKQTVGHRSYQAPELKSDHTEIDKSELYKADIWSLGKVFAELCMLEVKNVKIQSTKNVKTDVDNMLGQIEKRYSADLAGILKDMLNFDPGMRKDIEEIKEIIETRFGNILKNAVKEDLLEEQKDDETIVNFLDEMNSAGDIKDGRCSAGSLENIARTLKKSLENFKIDLDHEFLDIKVNEDKVYDVFDRTVTNIMKEIRNVIPENCRKNIERFTLDLSKCNEITNKSLEELCQIENIFPRLTQIHLNFSECNNINKFGVKNLKNAFGPNLKRLEKLTLNFKGCTQVNDEDVLYVGSEIRKKIPTLAVKLDFNWGSGNTSRMPTSIKISKI